MWLSGKLCYWRNNPNYSEATKQKLEERMKKMTAKNQPKDYDND
jgi:hypothetical protein